MVPKGPTIKILNGLTISHWNANGLESKLHDVELYLKKYKVDIMLINETKLKATKNVSVSGYHVIRKDRDGNTSAGGVLILVRNTIDCTEVPIKTENIEAVGAKIDKKFTVVSAYLRPQNKFSKQDFDNMLNVDQKVVILGDLNSKHGSWNPGSRANQKGNQLFDYTMNNNCTILAPEEFTHYPYAENLKPSIIDIAVVKNMANCRSLEVVNELDSDHLPIIMEISNNLNVTERENTYLDYSKADWKKFRTVMNQKTDLNIKLPSIDSVDCAVEKLTTDIQSAMAKSIPSAKVKGFCRVTDQEIKDLIHERNSLRRISQRTKDPKDRIAKNKITNLIGKKVKNMNNSNWEKKMTSLKTSDNSLWKFTKHLTKKHDYKMPHLHGPNGLVFSEQEKADLLAENFEKVHHQTEDFGDDETDSEVKLLYDKLVSEQVSAENIKFVSPSEVRKAIKSLKPKKAPGPDGIQNIILKNLPHKAIVQLTNIFNACMKYSHFPQNWKQAEVLAFPKPGKTVYFHKTTDQ